MPRPYLTLTIHNCLRSMAPAAGAGPLRVCRFRSLLICVRNLEKLAPESSLGRRIAGHEGWKESPVLNEKRLTPHERPQRRKNIKQSLIIVGFSVSSGKEGATQRKLSAGMVVVCKRTEYNMVWDQRVVPIAPLLFRGIIRMKREIGV